MDPRAEKPQHPHVVLHTYLVGLSREIASQAPNYSFRNKKRPPRHATPRHATPRHATPRYRESFGRYYEYFTVGDVYKHRPGRTISETDNTWFTLLTMNTHPLHFDAAYAAESEFGRLLVNSCLTLSMVVGMSVSDLSQKAIANLGWDKIKLTAPVFIGDTIYSESQVLAKRESKSRPGQGIVTVLTTGTKADGSEFMHFERTFLVSKRGKA